MTERQLISDVLKDMLVLTTDEIIQKYSIEWLWENVIIDQHLTHEEYIEYVEKNYGCSAYAAASPLILMSSFIEIWKKNRRKLTLVDKIIASMGYDITF